MATSSGASALAAGVAVLAIVRLGGFATGWDYGPDRWLFVQKLEQYATPNRMSPNSAGCFLLSGLCAAAAGREARGVMFVRPSGSHWRPL